MIRGDDVHQSLSRRGRRRGSRRASRRASAAVLTVVAMAGSVLMGSPAHAADLPTLTSLTVSPTTVAAPGQAVVSYTAEGGDPIVEAWAYFVTDRNSLRKVTMTTGSTGSGPLTVPAGSETGTWRLASVNLRTGPDTITRVCATFWAPGVTGCTETRDLTAHDVSVQGVPPDYDAPRLGSVTVTPASPKVIVPGQELTVAWTLAAPAPDLAYAEAAFTRRSTGASGPLAYSNDPAVLASGTIRWRLGEATDNGDYDLRTLTLCDRLSNCAVYRPDGTVTLTGGARTPTGAQPTFGGSLKVYEDHDYPVLTSMRLTAPSVLIGKPVSFTYAVQDEQTTLPQVRLRYTYQGDGQRELDVSRTQAPRSGTITTTLDRIGSYKLDWIDLGDGHTSFVMYQRDGKIVDERFGTVIGTHSIDFDALDIRVLPQAPKLTARAWGRGAKIDFQPGLNDDSGHVTGYEIVAEPGHHVSRVTGSNIYNAYLKDLTAGTRYTVKVTALSAAGPGPATTFTVTPMLTSNVVGIGDLDRDGHGDLVALRRDWTHTFGYWGNGKGGFDGGARNIADVVPGTRILPAGDLIGSAGIPGQTGTDGIPDLIAEHAGRLELYQGSRGAGFLTDPTVASTGWSTMRFITGGGDFSGDGRADVLGVTSTGVLNLYPGTSRGTVAAGRQIGSGWQIMTSVFMTADFNGDRTRDILAVDSAGVLWLYPGNGKGGFRGVRSKVGTGWNTLGSVGPLGDWTGDGKADVVGITMAGEFRLYAGNGTGRVYAGRVIGTGWQRYF